MIQKPDIIPETKETYLKELIDSVLSQTYGNFELIIADAGTSSKVERTVSAYSDKRIRYFRLKNNGGRYCSSFAEILSKTA